MRMRRKRKKSSRGKSRKLKKNKWTQMLKKKISNHRSSKLWRFNIFTDFKIIKLLIFIGKINKLQMIEKDRKQFETYPVYLGALSSVISLVICSGLVLIYEPTWTYNIANYYFVTSFLLIGL